MISLSYESSFSYNQYYIYYYYSRKQLLLYISDEEHLYYSFTDKSKVGFIIGGNEKNLKRIEKSTAARIHYDKVI